MQYSKDVFKILASNSVGSILVEKKIYLSFTAIINRNIQVLENVSINSTYGQHLVKR